MEQSKKPPRSYKDLKQKQKAKISDYMYLETQDFFQTNGRMPDTDEDCKAVAQKVFNHLSGLRVPTEEIHAVYLRKRPHIIERLTIFWNAGAYPFPCRNQGIAAHPSGKKSPYQAQKETCQKGAEASAHGAGRHLFLHRGLHLRWRAIWSYLGGNGIGAVGRYRVMCFTFSS